MKRLALLAVLLALAGCNTFEGMGRDMQSAGQGLSNSARNVREKI